MNANPLSSKSSTQTAEPRRVVVIDKKIVDVTQIALAKRFQPLKGPLEAYPPEARAKMGVGLHGLNGPIAFWATVDPAKQAQILQEIRNALADAGLLENFQLIPDGSLLLPQMVQSGGCALYPNGWVVQFFGPSTKKPLLTCLLESEADCEQVIHEVAARVNASIA